MFLFLRPKKAQADTIGGNTLPIGDIQRAAQQSLEELMMLQSVANRIEQQKAIDAADKKVFEDMNPGLSYEKDFLGGMGNMKGFVQ